MSLNFRGVPLGAFLGIDWANPQTEKMNMKGACQVWEEGCLGVAKRPDSLREG